MRRYTYTTLKYILDFIFSFLLLLLLLPLLLFLILLLIMTGEGEIFFRQERIGWLSKKFAIYKFATMLKASPNLGAGTLTEYNDPRVTKFGRYLRKYKLNELPQLINILNGDMSFVGPRPLDEKGFLAYSPEVKSVISSLRPGITGVGSIIFRDEEKLFACNQLPAREFYNLHIAPYKGEVEVWYSQNCNFWTDIRILFITIWALFFPNTNIIYSIFKTLPKKPTSLILTK